MGKKNIGSNFDDFLKEDAMLDDATAVALKRVTAWQIAEEMGPRILPRRSWRNACTPVGRL